jgi:MFS family permease
MHNNTTNQTHARLYSTMNQNASNGVGTLHRDEINLDYDSHDGSGDLPTSYQNTHHPELNRGRSTTNTANTANRTDSDFDDIPISRATKIFAMCAALNSCNLGYDIGVNTSAGKLLQDENSLALTDGQLEIFMGSLNLFAAVGALGASAVSDKYGRRGGFIVAAFSFVLGVLLMSFAQSYDLLMFGRVFVGLGVGFGLSVDPVYISELSPPKYRGYLVTWSEIATNVGILLGFCSGLVFENVAADRAWRLMFGMGTILPVVLTILVLWVMPESPRWLVKEGRENEAKEVLTRVYPPDYDVSKVVDEIKDAIIREEEAENAVGWDIIFFPSPAFKRMLLVGIGSAVAQQIVGIDAIQYFLMYIIEEAGIKDRTWQSIILIVLGILKVSVIVLAGHMFDSRGRRPLMFMSLIGKFFRDDCSIFVLYVYLYKIHAHTYDIFNH